MLAIDLPVTRAGVDLDPLYEKWGLESVAVSEQTITIPRIAQSQIISQFIVDNDFRPIFKPANNRILSPAAAYDLSQDFRRPVRVFGKSFLSAKHDLLAKMLLPHRT
jgi:hypothetical protein